MREVKHIELSGWYDNEFIKKHIADLEPDGWALLRICVPERREVGIFGFVVFEREAVA